MTFNGKILEAHQLQRKFPRTAFQLNADQLEITAGERIALVGGNGAGKTTFLRIAATLLTPTSGDLRIFGESVTKSPEKVRCRIGWIPARDQSFFPRLTGIENLKLFSSMLKVNKKQMKEKISFFEDFFSLKDIFQTPYYLCSSGMKQILSFVRSQLHDPDLTLMDEPTRSLDSKIRDQLYTYFTDSTSEKSLLFSSHSKEEVKELAHRIYEIDGGRVV